MTNKQILRVFIASMFALLMAALATPASAQQGSLRGKVVDEAGKPVPDAELTLEFVGDYQREYKVKTDSKGEWVKAGLPPGGGTWTITATKGPLTGVIRGVSVRIGEMSPTGDIVVKAGNSKSAETAKMSNDEIEKRNKRQKELEQLFTDANTAIDASDYDEALIKLTAITTEVPKCAACFSKMGDVYVKKSDLAKAEESYLKAIEIDPTLVDPYNALASVYNSQKKFDDAAKMSAKANELQTAAGGAGGGSAESLYNQGIIFWNQGKIAEAKAQFQKVIELDPKMADAQYWYGMALVNEGKLPEAKKPFEEYMKLAPTGQYAETAKAMLAMIK
jgi:tetratricopeptide (TPR) repeat protein